MRLAATKRTAIQERMSCPVGAWVRATPPTVSAELIGRVSEVDGPFRCLTTDIGLSVLVAVDDCRHIPEPIRD